MKNHANSKQDHEDLLDDTEICDDSENLQDCLVDPKVVHKHSYYAKKQVHKSHAANSILNKTTKVKSSKERLLRIQDASEVASNIPFSFSQSCDDFY